MPIKALAIIIESQRRRIIVPSAKRTSSPARSERIKKTFCNVSNNFVHWYLRSSAGKNGLDTYRVLDQKVFDANTKAERLTWRQYQLYRGVKSWIKWPIKNTDKPQKIEENT